MMRTLSKSTGDKKWHARILLIYESGIKRGAWKGERVYELITALTRSRFQMVFFGLRGPSEMPMRVSRRRAFILFALPGLLSRVSIFVTRRPRELRTAVSQRLFAVVTWPLSPCIVLTQTTLGQLIERLKARGHVVWAESDMTCPLEWHRVLMREAERIDASEDIIDELPSASRIAEEQRAFVAADRIVVLSPWALDSLPGAVRAKAVMVPPVSVPPAERPLEGHAGALRVEFLFVGQVGFRKGAHLLVEAIGNSVLCSATFHVFGEVRCNFLRYMERSNLSFPPNTQLHGAGAWREFVKARPRRYVAVLPSFVEGSPRVIYEAASLGIPAIVSPAARPAFFKDDREALVLSRPDAEQLRDAASRLLIEPALWQRLSANAYSAYRDTYNAASYGKEVVALLAGSNA